MALWAFMPSFFILGCLIVSNFFGVEVFEEYASHFLQMVESLICGFLH